MTSSDQVDTANPGKSGRPVVRQITPSDLKIALRKGWEDFDALPSFAVFLVFLYPLVALMVARVLFGYDVLVILFPMITGFALLGPLAASGIYELSRRRELGLDVFWTHVFDVVKSPSFLPMAFLGVLLMVIFVFWIGMAQAIYDTTMGPVAPASFSEFVSRVFSTPEGRELILVGCGVGFLFAVFTLSVSVVSFPILLDRKIGIFTAIWTSVRAVGFNPVTMSLWGLTVGGLLILGSIPFFFGLAVVIPILGHSTWHLYRLVVEPE
jgi:uncharacterized membrane protein